MTTNPLRATANFALPNGIKLGIESHPDAVYSTRGRIKGYRWGAISTTVCLGHPGEGVLLLGTDDAALEQLDGEVAALLESLASNCYTNGRRLAALIRRTREEAAGFAPKPA